VSIQFIYLSYIVSTIALALILAVPVITMLYKLKIVRFATSDFSTIIEDRKDKVGTPIMGGLIFIIPVIIINYLFNFNYYTAIPLLIFTVSAGLGGLDDILNIYGKKRKKRKFSRILKLIKVHKSILFRIKHILLLPWHLYSNFVNAFESNPGKGLLGSEKFIVQIILGIVLGIWLYLQDGGLLWFPFIGDIHIGYFIVPFSIFAILGMTNAVNFSDGMDGLAAGMLLMTVVGLVIMSLSLGTKELGFLSSTLAGGLITYLYFNIPPARVQMGDVGSFAMGSMITVIALAMNRAMILPLIGFPFVVEVSSTIIQSIGRRLLGRRIFKMAPLHHHFEMLGWSEEKVVMRFWIFSIISVVIGLWVSMM